MGFLRPPTPDDLVRAGQREHLNLPLEECQELAPFAADFLRAFDEVEELPDLQVPVRYPRTPGSRPSPEAVRTSCSQIGWRVPQGSVSSSVV